MIYLNQVSSSYSELSDIIVILMYISATLFLFKGNWFYRAILPVVLLIIILIINITVNIMMGAIFNMDSETLIQERNTVRLISLFITKFTFFLIVRVGIRIMKYRDIKLKLDEWFAITAVFLISVVILISSADIQYERSDSSVHMIILIIGMAMINIATLVFINKMTSKNQDVMMLRILKTQIAEQRKTFESIEQMYKNMMILKHDMKNEWIVIYQALKNQKYTLAEEVAEKMLRDRIDSFVEYIKVSSDTINAVLNYKLNEAKNKGIDISCQIQDDFNCFDDNDVAMLVSNLLDNAIEASVSQQSPAIQISIASKKNYLSIVISNKIEKLVLKKNAELKTTKKDTFNHGLGTKSIRIIAEKYGGMTDFYEENGLFVADIMLNKSYSLQENIPVTN